MRIVTTKTVTNCVLAILLCEFCFFSAAFAEGEIEDAQAIEVDEKQDTKGILPIPDYSGDLRTRSYLFGDLGGRRDTLAQDGIQFNIEYYQYIQAIVDGGVDTGDQWGGKASYALHLDLQKMGVMPGALVYARFDSRWGEGVIGKTGQLLPANEAYLIPVDFNDLERETGGALTALTYTQFLSPKFGMFLGKIDMMDGDPNEFAGGRGDTQFLNYSMMYAAPTAIVPASTVGAGVIYMPNENVTLVSQLVSGTDSSFDSFDTAFDDWDQGQIWVNALMTQYRVRDHLPGGFNATYLNWFNAEFTDIGSVVGSLTSTKEESWLLALSAWQYLYTEESSEGPLNLSNKIPDLQGWGLFARLGFADKDTNPFKTTVSFGAGGRGVFPNRDDDLLGIGYFYTETESGNVLTTVGGLDDSTQGFEAFYNLQITPAAMFAVDLQWLEASLPDTDNAVVLGGRLQLKF
jgi:porin